MLTIEEIRERLDDRSLAKVSARTGVAVHTLRRLMRGEVIRYQSIKALSDYLTRKEVA